MLRLVELREAGVTAATMSRMERAGEVIRLSRGVYQLPDAELDPNHSLAEAAVRFVLSLNGVSTVLGGFSDTRQVEENAACSGKGPLSVKNMKRIEMAWRANFGLDAPAD